MACAGCEKRRAAMVSVYNKMRGKEMTLPEQVWLAISRGQIVVRTKKPNDEHNYKRYHRAMHAPILNADPDNPTVEGVTTIDQDELPHKGINS